MKLFWKLTLIGIIAGMIFSGYLKIIEQLTAKKVYILLMNVDYFPIYQWVKMGGWIEYLLHIIVSAILVPILYVGFKRFLLHLKVSSYILMNIMIGCVLFLTTTFSERTPDVTDVFALFYWISGHVLYGFVVGVMIISMSNRGIK